ncbi:MAG: sulfatase [Planctomycetes bacterium]|nr:sulfatase [Planctomycetota bacterium]
MTSRLLHGLLLGASIACVSLFLELQLHFRSYPYHHDFAFFWTWLPEYALAGSLLGLLAGGLLRFLDRSGQVQRQTGLHLAALIIGLGISLISGSTTASLESPQDIVIKYLVAISAGGLSVLLFTGFAQSRYAWTISGFTTPWFCVLALALIFGSGLSLGKFGPQSWPPSPSWLADHENQNLPVQPNVLLVVLDGVGASHLGSYGYHRSTSPELDRIAGEGVVFENAFAAAAWTLPSHASLFTSLQLSSHGVGWQNLHLGDGRQGSNDAYTLAEALALRGFQTCGISNSQWLSHQHGLSQGFDYYFDLQATPIPDRLFLSQLLSTFGISPRQARLSSSSLQAVTTALSWLHQPRMREPKQPFFMFVHLDEADAPYHLPEDFADATRFLPAGTQLSDLTPAQLGSAESRQSYHLGLRELEKDEAAIQQALYDASILYLDGLLHKLLEGLREQNALENTLVIVTSSHGEEFLEHGRFGHQFSLSDRVLHVPLIMRLPKMLPAGSRVPSLASLVDVAPTIFGVLNKAEDQEPRNGQLLWEGFDLGPVMHDPLAAPRDWVLAQYQNPARLLLQQSTALSAPQTMVARSITTLRSDLGKYFRFGDGSASFSDLATDPNESAAERSVDDKYAIGFEREYAQTLDQLENWLKTRRTLLQGAPASDAEQLAEPSALKKAETLRVPPILFGSKN